MTDRKMDRSDGRGFGRQQLLANSTEKISFHIKKKKWLVAARSLQIIQTFKVLMI